MLEYWEQGQWEQYCLLFSNQNGSGAMKDINWEAIAKGYGSMNDIIRKLIKIKKISTRGKFKISPCQWNSRL